MKEYASLRDVLASSTSTDEEKAAAQARVNELVGQIGDILPNAIKGWVILDSVDHMNELINEKLKYAGIK